MYKTNFSLFPFWAFWWCDDKKSVLSKVSVKDILYLELKILYQNWHFYEFQIFLEKKDAGDDKKSTLRWRELKSMYSLQVQTSLDFYDFFCDQNIRFVLMPEITLLLLIQ